MMESDKTPENEIEQRKVWKKPEVIDIDGEIEAGFGPASDGGDSTTS